MSDPSPARAIRSVLAAAAAVDWCFALLILVPVRPVMDLLGIPIGEPVMHFRFAGLLFALLPVFYVLGAVRADLAPAIGSAAAVVRALGSVFLIAHLLGGAPAAYGLFLAVEIAFAIAHVWSLHRDGTSIIGALAPNR